MAQETTKWTVKLLPRPLQGWTELQTLVERRTPRHVTRAVRHLVEASYHNGKPSPPEKRGVVPCGLTHIRGQPEPRAVLY